MQRRRFIGTVGLAAFAGALGAGAANAPAARTRAPEKGSAAEKPGAADWTFEPDPALPNVLILGDSISIGYTLEVRKLLKGKANVFRPMNASGRGPENCSGTTHGVEAIDRWLEGRKWAVIHFNWGLHDLKHVKPPKGDASSDPNDPVQATVEQYEKNMAVLVSKLKATGARLVFAATTPVAPGTTGPLREPDAPPRYNEAAVRIMKANGIRVNDLHAFALPKLADIQLPKNVHFTPAGSRVLAEEVARVIGEELAAAAKK